MIFVYVVGFALLIVAGVAAGAAIAYARFQQKQMPVARTEENPFDAEGFNLRVIVLTWIAAVCTLGTLTYHVLRPLVAWLVEGTLS